MGSVIITRDVWCDMFDPAGTAVWREFATYRASLPGKLGVTLELLGLVRDGEKLFVLRRAADDEIMLGDRHAARRYFRSNTGTSRT